MFDFSVTSWLNDALGLSREVQGNLFRSLIAIFIIWLVHAGANRYLVSRIEEPGVRYRTRKSIVYLFVFIGVLVVGRIWYTGVRSLATFLGLLTAGVAIALSDLLASFAGWLFIIWRRPFEVGDRIQVGDHAGDVVDQRIFLFTIMEIGNWVDADQTTGRIIHVPNSKVFREPIANYSRGVRFIWNELPILVTFESQWEDAKEILQEIAENATAEVSGTAMAEIRRARSRFFLGDVDLAPRVYTSVEDSGVMLTLRYICDPRRRRASAERLWEDVLRAFATRDDIDFAYPSVRYYDNRTEGKIGARAGDPMTAVDQPRSQPS